MSNISNDDSVIDGIGQMVGKDNLGSILLLFAIVNFGLLYVCIRYSNTDTDLGPLTYIACRFIVSLLYLVAVYYIAKFCGKSNSAVESFDSTLEQEKTNKQFWFDLILWGSLVSVVLLGLTVFIQYGEATQSAGTTSFIIGMYVVFIPLSEMVISGFAYTLPWRTWIALAIVIPGIFIISGCTEMNCFSVASFQWGLFFNIMAMFCVTGHTLCTSRGMAKVGPSKLIIFSFSLAAVLSTILALIFEIQFWVYPFTAITTNWWLILLSSFAEFFSIVALTVALGFISTSRAAVVMSVESLAGAVCGYIFLGETFTGVQYIGGAMLLFAVVLEIWPQEYSCGLLHDDGHGYVPVPHEEDAERTDSQSVL